VRGHRLRGVRDLLPLIMPLLVTALERAMQLAESMEARGFGGQMLAVSARQRITEQLAILVGLGALGAGFAGSGFWPGRRILVGLLLAIGGGALIWAFWDQGRRVRRTRYRRWRWERADRVVLVISASTALGWLVAWLMRGDWLFFYPYPPYSPWPTFQPVLGLLILALAAPGLLLRPDAGIIASNE